MTLITKPSAHLTPDSRFKSWGRLVREPAHVDLAQERGYALVGPWVNIGESVGLSVGEYLIVACETGSRAHHYYDYLLVTVEETVIGDLVDESLVEYTGKDILLLLEDEALGVKPRQLCKARNSDLYAFALYVAKKMEASQ